MLQILIDGISMSAKKGFPVKIGKNNNISVEKSGSSNAVKLSLQKACVTSNTPISLCSTDLLSLTFQKPFIFEQMILDVFELENSVDPDELASDEASSSGSLLFFIQPVYLMDYGSNRTDLRHFV